MSVSSVVGINMKNILNDLEKLSVEERIEVVAKFNSIFSAEGHVVEMVEDRILFDEKLKTLREANYDEEVKVKLFHTNKE